MSLQHVPQTNLALSVIQREKATPKSLIQRPTLSETALYGLAGRIIKKLDPQTESHPAGNLMELLISFGSVVGRSAYYQVEDTRHYMNEMMVKVGESSRARKGTGKNRIRAIMKHVDADWLDNRNTGGIGSGEVIPQLIRDSQFETVINKKTGESETVMMDSGVDDKRLHINIGEFQGILSVCHRPESLLSSVIRDGWDSLPLRNTVKNNAASCLEPHLSIAADTTVTDLSVNLDQADRNNGFANRFLWVFVHKNRELPMGGEPLDWTEEIQELRQAVGFTQQQKRIFMDKQARDYWTRTLYSKLEAEVPGLVGALTSRASAHTIRLALLYAMLDKSDHIRLEHLEAAESLWQYCEDSVQTIFGDLLTPEQQQILDYLIAGPATKTDLYRKCFQNHRKGPLIQNDLQVLLKTGKIEVEEDENGLEFYSLKHPK